MFTVYMNTFEWKFHFILTLKETSETKSYFHNLKAGPGSGYNLIVKNEFPPSENTNKYPSNVTCLEMRNKCKLIPMMIQTNNFYTTRGHMLSDPTLFR